MRKPNILLSLFVFIGGLTGTIIAQTAVAPATAPKFLQGEIISIAPGKIVLQTKDGSVEATLADKTEFKRVSADNPSLKTAVAAALSDIGVGDKVVVTGSFLPDNKRIPAKVVYLMSKSDISQKQNKEREEWRARGITGQVAAVNPQTKEITVSQRGIAGERKIILSLKENANFRRYAEGSVDYSEAKTSSFDDIKVGDSIRAMGDKNEDGSTVKAERVVSGSFQTVAGAITAIDPAKNEITILNVQTKKPVIVVVGKNSVLKQFPAEMAQRMTQFQTAGVAPGQGSAPARPPQPSQSEVTPGQNPNRPAAGGMRGGGGGNIDDMLDRFPNISLADLKVGDMIAVSSTKNTAAAERVSAIKLLSGVEPFIKAQQQQQTAAGRPRGGQDSGFSIPGLEGGSSFP